MRVQPRIRSPQFPSHAHPIPTDQNHVPVQSNGIHSDSRPRYSAFSTNQLNGDGMNPYQNLYGAGNGPPQQQPHRQYPPPNQLPPMYNNNNMSMPPSMTMPPPMQPQGGGVAGTNAAQYQAIVPATNPTGLPQPGAAALAAQNENGPKSLSGTNGRYRFELRVEQQPQRARMCGFGDKDRRPITPPPCVRLLIFDEKTNEEVPHDHVDGSFFVLQVDLWDENATREVNLVRASTSSPAASISAASTTSFPPTEAPRQVYLEPQPGVFATSDGMQVFTRPSNWNQIAPYPPTHGSAPHHQNYYQPVSAYHPSHGAVPYTPVQYSTSQNMFTRNLIGSLTVNAASLKDTEGKLGYWFILQDLSVRTEGYFRLRMNFIDVGIPQGGGLNKTRAPVLAFVYSDKFQVYSAKKFPGVIESTPLSKAFAQQGIKIPIRKDTKAEKEDDDED